MFCECFTNYCERISPHFVCYNMLTCRNEIKNPKYIDLPLKIYILYFTNCCERTSPQFVCFNMLFCRNEIKYMWVGVKMSRTASHMYCLRVKNIRCLAALCDFGNVYVHGDDYEIQRADYGTHF